MAILIDIRLYFPKNGCHDEARCKKVAIPEEVRQFFSKSQLALAMLEIARQRGRQFGYVGIDGDYGKESAFLGTVDEQGCHVAERHCDQAIYLQDSEPQTPEIWRRLTLLEGVKRLIGRQAKSEWGIPSEAQVAD